MAFHFMRKSAPVESVTPERGDNIDFLRALMDGSQRGPSAHARMFRTNPYVNRAVSLRATAVSKPDLVLLDSDGNPVKDRRHPLLTLLNRPNPRDDWHSFAYQIEVQMALHGACYVYIERSGNSVRHLHVIPAERVTPQQSTSILNPVAYYDVDLGNEQRRCLPSDVIFIHTALGDDGYTPVSPLDSASLSVASYESARQWNDSLFRNGAKPMMCIEVPDKLTRQSFTEFSSLIRGTLSGSQNAGTTAVLDGGKKMSMLGYSPTDCDFTNGMAQLSKEIAIALGMPLPLIGDSTTYANMETATRDLAIHTIVPELELIVNSLFRRFAPAYPDVTLSYDREMVEGLSTDKTALMGTVENLTYLTLNERRAVFSYPPVPDGDRVMVNMNLVPLSEALDTTEPEEGAYTPDPTDGPVAEEDADGEEQDRAGSDAPHPSA